MFVLFLPRNLREKLKGSKALLWLLDLLFIYLLVSVVFVVLFKWFEKTSWIEAVWQVWQTSTTIGYGNAPAATLEGRLMTMFLGLAGIAVLGATISAVFDFRESKKAERRFGLMKNKQKDGYIVFNFPGASCFEALVKELQFVENNVGICLVDNKIEELPISCQVLSNVHFVKGSILDKETYERANLKEAKAVVVFPSQPGVSSSDGETKTVVELISRFIKNGTRIMHLLVDQQNSWLFKDVDSTPINEGLETLAIVQELQGQYTAPTITSMLLNSEGANPISVSAEDVAGIKWEDLQIKVIAACRSTDERANLLALVKDGTPDPCPAGDTVIDADDTILVIAFNGFDWKSFVGVSIKDRVEEMV